MTKLTQQEREFFAFVNERENIRLRREAGEDTPWTKDPILAAWFFCNVNREDDVSTKLVARHFRPPQQPTRISWLVLARWLSRGALAECGMRFGVSDTGAAGATYDPKAVHKFMTDYANEEGKVFHGAFMLRSPFGSSKVEHIVEAAARAQEVMDAEGQPYRNLSEAHKAAMRIPMFGGFMAYELVTDMAHTDMIRDPRERWANLGPGALRGIALIYPDSPTGYTHRKEQIRLDLTLGLMDKANGGAWEHDWEWTPREAEHCLCEFAKYKKIQATGKGKRHYRPLQQRSII